MPKGTYRQHCRRCDDLQLRSSVRPQRHVLTPPLIYLPAPVGHCSRGRVKRGACMGSHSDLPPGTAAVFGACMGPASRLLPGPSAGQALRRAVSYEREDDLYGDTRLTGCAVGLGCKLRGSQQRPPLGRDLVIGLVFTLPHST